MVSSISGSLAASWASSLFSKLDTNNQGYIDKGGLQSAFSQLAATDSTSDSTDVDQIFTQLDTDGDGRITETELSDTLTTLMDQLYSKDGSMCGGMGMPPPGGMDAAADQGFTQDELTSMAQEIGSSDSKHSSLITRLAANFDTADTDGNGRVSRDEAMAFAQAGQTDGASTVTTDSVAAGTTGDGLDGKAAALMKLIELIQSYASSDGDTDASSASTLSFTA
jgi:Ca2+-binding EF-hand superfamily protein